MYRMVILDDEEIVIRGIQKVFSLDEFGFEVVGTFQNPKTALAELVSLEPDLIITDIKMPQMDGLEFSRNAKELLPEAEIVILSGYDDFSFAQNAVKLGVSDYLLKPTKKKEFSEMLEKMFLKIDEKKKQAEYLENLKKIASGNLRELKNQYLLALAEVGVVSDEQFLGIEQQIKEEYKNNSYFLAKIILHEINAEKDYMFLMGQFLDEVETELSGFGKIESFNTDEELCFIIFSEEKDRNAKDIEEVLFDYIEAKKQEGITVFFAVSNQYDDLGNLFVARNECDEKILIFTGQIYNNSSILNTDILESEVHIPYKEMEQLFHYIIANETENIKDTINDIYQFPDNIVFRDFSYSITYLILVKFRHLWNRYDISNNIISGDLLDLRNLRRDYAGVSAQKDLIEKVAMELASKINGQSVMLTSKIIMNAVSYIQKHYNENISLSNVADNINVSKNYLSDLFRKELNISFLNYVTDLRVEKAKYYLTQTDMKMYEIADSVGYNDYAYFSTLFKKYTGKTLSQYRRQN